MCSKPKIGIFRSDFCQPLSSKSLPFGMKPRDPWTLAMAFVILLTVAAFASFLPAYRPSKFDPMLPLARRTIRLAG